MMLRVLKAALIAVTITAAFAPAAQAASVSWPATCHGFTCVNRHLNAAHATDLRQRQRIVNLQAAVTSLSDALNRVQNRLGCVGQIAFATYRLPGAYDRNDIFRQRGDTVGGQYTAIPRFFGPNWDPWN